MRLVTIVLGMAVLVSFEAFAQKESQKKSASRYEKYKVADVTQVDELLQEARRLSPNEPALALEKVEEALGISLSNREVILEAKCYIVLGEINDQAQEWKLSHENYKAAYDRLLTHGMKGDHTNDIVSCLKGMANALVQTGDFEQALERYEEALGYGNTRDEAARIRVGVSEVYYRQGRYDDALAVLDEATRDSRRREPDVVALVENQRAKIYARTNEVERARQSLESAQKNSLSNRGAVPAAQDAITVEAKDQVADAFHEQQRYDEEIDLRNQSIEYNLGSNNLPEVSRDKIGIGRALAAKGETNAAIRELREAALIADTIGNPKDQANAFLTLADLYQKNGMPDDAIASYQKFSEAVKKSEAMNQTRLTEKADLIQRQRSLEELQREVEVGLREDEIAQAALFRQRLVIYGLVVIIVIVVTTSWFIYKSARESKVANQLLALKSLRSQMNPHFIFNALNSVNQFIALNDEKAANKFLSDFSRLMRLVLENSQEDFITLEKEREIISLYLKLEHYRFRDKFDYKITVDEQINIETQVIPPMLVQPYIENAVWHGLRYKAEKGLLSLHFRKAPGGLHIEIADNGIGRTRSAELKTSNQKKQVSTGLKNIRERLDIINRVYKTGYAVDIADMDPENGTGTRVTIKVPRVNGRIKRIEKQP